MIMTGIGRSYGAITVLNAIPAGIGATIGTELKTVALFSEMPDSDQKTVIIRNGLPDSFSDGHSGLRDDQDCLRTVPSSAAPDLRTVPSSAAPDPGTVPSSAAPDPGTVPSSERPDDRTAKVCVENAYAFSGIPCPSGYILEIGSEIPASRGLKSSSSVCNAVLEAVFDEISRKHGAENPKLPEDPVSLIRLGVDCARQAGVTVTGAFDDACGCHLGGFVMTDNREDRLLFRRPYFGDFDVVIAVPGKMIRKTELPTEKMKAAAGRSLEIASIAVVRPFDALTKNGGLIAEILGEDNSAAEKALSLGAFAAGMSGTGPAVAFLLEKGTAYDFIEKIGKYAGPDVTFLITGVRNSPGVTENGPRRSF